METVENEALAKELFSLTPLLLQTMFRAARADGQNQIPPTQLQAMFTLRLEQPQNMTQLSRRLHISKQQLTRVVDCLVQRELVERRPGEHNRRVILIRLTPEGERYVDELADHRARRMGRNFTTLNNEEKHILMLASSVLKKHFGSMVAGVEDRPRE